MRKFDMRLNTSKWSWKDWAAYAEFLLFLQGTQEKSKSPEKKDEN